MISITKILCPIDFSEASYKALQAADGLASQYSSELYLLHVVLPIPTFTAGIESPQFDVPSYEHGLMSSAEKSLQEVAEQKISKGLRVHPMVVLGDPADQIVHIAMKENVEVIVIATHGRTGWRHLVFGSVAEKVIRLSPCPVLVVRGPREED